MTAPAPPQHSPDGKWWWDGARWVPAQPGPFGARRRAGLPAPAIAALIALALVAGGISIVLRPSDYATTFSYHPGDGHLSGKATNNTGQGCSHFTVHAKFYDNNDALIDNDALINGEFQQDIGQVGAGRSQDWSADMTVYGAVPYSLPRSVSRADSWATCEDQH